MELLEEQKREIEVLRLPRREQHFHVAEAMKGRVRRSFSFVHSQHCL